MQIGFIGLGNMGAPIAANLLRDHLLQTIAQEGEDIDWCAIANSVKRNAGL